MKRGIYFLYLALLAQPVIAQTKVKSQATISSQTKADSLITPTDTLVFIKQPILKLSKPEMLVKQATEKQAKPLEAIALYKKAIAAKTAAQDSNWAGDIHLAMAKLFFKTNNSEQGFLELLTAQALFKQSQNISCQAAITNEIAAIYEKNNDWTEAEKYYLLALKQQETNGLTEELPYTALALAKGYHKRKEYTKASKYLAASVNQFELNAEKNKRGEAYMLLLDITKRKKSFVENESLLLKRMLPYFSGVGSTKGKLECFDMLGQIYQLQKRNSEAKWFYLQANTLSRANNNINGTVSSLINLAEVKSTLGEYKSALKDLREADLLAKKKNNLPLMADVKLGYTFYNKTKASQAAAKAKLAANASTSKGKVLAETKPKTAVKTGQL
ncbi:tetratricopeptide repeat protein [Desertivirga xinjiangensis]|uniref:tetratricopeptide repeat protein n=1 Tax=Desertivirga xinjiangensis TaxID=539206 RepID=UPI00210B2326|nr:tetratricopeptide repeat protein [Pedobacter xinjiangensis]